MPTTPVFGWPYQARGDAPNGPVLGEQLALAIEATVNGIVGLWVPWAPTLVNLTLGSGTVTAKYRQIGKTVDYRFKFKLGAGSAVGTAPGFTLPVAPHADYVGDEDLIGIGRLLDAATLSYDAIVRLQGGSTVDFSAVGTSGATGTGTGVTATIPFTWGSGDSMVAYGRYEAA